MWPLAALLPWAAAGCVVTSNAYTCENPDPAHLSHDGQPDPCHYSSDNTAPACSGACVPALPGGWTDLMLLWVGPEIDAPACPDGVPALEYQGYADLNAPNQCAACTCGPPTGTCSLPPTMTASSSPACPGPDPAAASTPFDPPSGWDGSCTAHDAIPADQDCGGQPCVQSFTIAPLTINESGCAPAQASIPQGGALAWGTYARACKRAVYHECPGGDGFCMPEQPRGFKVCAFHEGDQACPSDLASNYVEKYVFYLGVSDTRSCTPCTCGAPVGSACSAQISVYTDGACSALLDTVTVTSSPSCHDVPAGSALGSKAAGPVTYTAGACQPGGGEPIGQAVPTSPATFCCLL